MPSSVMPTSGNGGGHPSPPPAIFERLHSRWDFRDVLPTGIAVAQPDLSRAGGISEVRRIAAVAEAHDVALAPHCPLALAACLQTDLAAPNFLIKEQSLAVHAPEGNALVGTLVDPAVFEFSDGHLARLRLPGLGIEIDERAVRHAAAQGHRWRNRMWRHADGSFAEWCRHVIFPVLAGRWSP